MVTLVSARHTYHTFHFRYRENGGKPIEVDLVIDLVHIPPKVEEPADPYARDPRMETLDPNEWKKQDHYMVLGLESKRECCTTEDVRNAYRNRVLVYHPDKIAQRKGEGKGKNQKDDAIFKCIQKAFQILSDADKKEAFDSVDPTFDNSIPDEKLPAGADFYSVYGPVFERNLKFSKKKTSLGLGGPAADRDEVEAFYQFWFDFESTRRFDYLDEDDCETGDNRADKRYMEKKNKAARQKRKTEDNTRIRTLAERAYKADPRIKAFKEADKQAKLNKKNNASVKPKASPVAQKKAEEEAAAKAQAEQARLAAEEAAKEAKKAKEAEANALRKEKKQFKAIFAEHNYFIPAGLDAQGKLKMLEEEAMLVEQICSKLARLEIQAVREEISAIVASGDVSQVTNVLRGRLGVAQVDRPSSPVPMVPVAAESAPVEAKPEAPSWTLHDTDVLINGTKKFPGGTRNRWETIADWFNRQVEHQRSLEEIIAKANAIKAATTGAATPLEAESWEPVAAKRDPRINQNEPTLATGVIVGEVVLPWSPEEPL